MSFYRRARLWGREKFDSAFCKRWETIERLGSMSSWNIDISRLDESSIVYSAGVGRDISFEKELVSRLGMDVEVFDPSPTGIGTMGLEGNRVNNIRFTPVGLAGKHAARKFSPPKDKSEGSYVLPAIEDEGIDLPCSDLLSLMSERGHRKIDLLKMDIEGFEYEVIENICNESIDIRQICVEFHHFFGHIGMVDTLKAISRLKRSGYSLIYKTRFDYTFLRQDGR